MALKPLSKFVCFRAHVLSYGMMRPFFLCLALFIGCSHLASAQLLIDKKLLKSSTGVLGGDQILNGETLDSLIIGSTEVDRWERFTNKFGESFSFGLFFSLPQLDYPYRILSWNLPFYGGAVTSGGLSDATVGADIWIGADTFEDISPDSTDASASGTQITAGAFQYAEVAFSFSGLPSISSPTSIALEAYYTSGPDSNAVSPIWTSDQRINRYFYSRPEADTDSTSTIELYTHDDFWALYNVDPSVFGELSGYLVVEYDTTSAAPPPDEDPLSTSLREKWYLPGSHTVVSNFPNPFNPSTVIRIMPQISGTHEIIIYDALGRMVKRETINAFAGNELQYSWDASSMASGVYHVSVRAGSERWHHTMTLTK